MDHAFLGNRNGVKGYEFVFQYVNPDVDLIRLFRFPLRTSERLDDVVPKISKVVDTAIKKRIEYLQQKKEENEQKLGAEHANSEENAPPQKSAKKPSVQKMRACFVREGHEINVNITCKELVNAGGELQFKLGSKVYSVLVNGPWISSYSLPEFIFVNCAVYPAEFETNLVERNLSEFSWYKSLDKENWSLVGREFNYTPSDDDVDYFLKAECIPRNAKLVGAPRAAISAQKVVMLPRPCPFELRHAFTSAKLSGKYVRVVSYNILADHYCKSVNAKTVTFGYCETYALSIDYRKQLILRELIGYNADIICVQETDYKIYKHYFRPEMSKLNYKALYNPKETKPEGLACFYNSARFKLVQTLSIVIGKEVKQNPVLGKLWNKISKNKSLSKRLTEQNTILQIVILRSVENSEILLVANTHLYFHPEADDIRLLQAGISSLFIEHIINRLKSTKKDRISLIFCGDFNSKPESGVYQLFTTGSFTGNDNNVSKNGEEPLKNIQLIQRRLLESAYGTPQYTNYTEDFKGCLDYIFYDKQNLKVAQTVPLLTVEQMSEHTAMPSAKIPSDHVALVVDFKWL